MNPIPIIWHSQEDSRGYYNCTTMLNWMFDQHICQHHIRPGVAKLAAREDGAVFIIHGGRQLGQIDHVNSDLEKFRYVIVILLGDEECSFPAEEIEHEHMRLWIQEPIPGRHDFADRFIIDGYTARFIGTRYTGKKNLDWIFAGQVTHERRRSCRDALQKLDWGGVIIESKGYCQGVSIDEYADLLSRAKIAPCPSGPFSPDAARPWEALQVGTLPILDDLSPTRREPGFWKYVLGDHPLPVVTEWDSLPWLIEGIKQDWEKRINDAIWWWEHYKAGFAGWLQEDWNSLREECSII